MKTFALVLALAGIIWYRSGSLIVNNILFKIPLPIGYLANGDYAADCEPLGPGPVQPDHPFNQLTYCEDIAFWELYDDVRDTKASSRFLLASCDANRKSWNTVMGPFRDPNPRGTLWVYRSSSSPQAATNEAAERVELKDYPEGHDFHPLGFDIWPSYSGNLSDLYVINHARQRSYIEHFILDPANPTVATYVRTLSSPYFISPNSLVLTSPDSFYVSNDHLLTRRLPLVGPILSQIETILCLPLSFISHVTTHPAPSKRISEGGHEPRAEGIASHLFAAKFLSFPNGIALSADRQKLAMASSAIAHVFFFARDPSTNALTRINEQTVQLPFCPDNVRFADSGDNEGEKLLVAGHSHFPSLIAVVKNSTDAASGSWALSLSPKADPHAETTFDTQAPISSSQYVSDSPYWTFKTLFQSNGQKGGWGTASTAIRDPDSGALYISGLYSDEGVLACRARGV